MYEVKKLCVNVKLLPKNHLFNLISKLQKANNELQNLEVPLVDRNTPEKKKEQESKEYNLKST